MSSRIAIVFLLSSASFAGAENLIVSESPPDIGVVHNETKGDDSGVADLSSLFHLLGHDTQHHLALALERHGEQSAMQDPEVNALMSGLLHDELEEREEASRKKWLEEREAEAKKRQEAEDKRKRESEAREAERDAAHKAHQEEMDKIRQKANEDRERSKAEMEERHRAHEEFMRKNQDRRDEAARKHNAAKEKHAAQWERMQDLLKSVHEGLEQTTDGWRDAPFWDDFFRNTSTVSNWQQLGFAHLEPALDAAAMQTHHHVLVLEPGSAGLAQSIAEGIRRKEVEQVLARAYGDEQSDSHDVVVEVGLLDAMAMGQVEGGDQNKLEALKQASNRLAKLVKPGGTWISVSAVPPTLRVPLLGRLTGHSFAVPSDSENPEAGTHTIVLRSPLKNLGAKGLRGAAASEVTNMLLYGSKDAHVWAYRMRRAEDASANPSDIPQSELDGLLDVIRQQRPATREDL